MQGIENASTFHNVCYSEAERKEEAKKRLEKRLEKRNNVHMVMLLHFCIT